MSGNTIIQVIIHGKRIREKLKVQVIFLVEELIESEQIHNFRRKSFYSNSSKRPLYEIYRNHHWSTVSQFYIMGLYYSLFKIIIGGLKLAKGHMKWNMKNLRSLKSGHCSFIPQQRIFAVLHKSAILPFCW